MANDHGDAHETTPLIPREEDASAPVQKQGVFTTRRRLLLCSFIVSLSYGFTQVPILYIFRTMVCQAYYAQNQLPNTQGEDHCAIRPVEARAAREIAILGASTTFCGILNLLVATWCIKKLGVKMALLIQVSWSAARLLTQNFGAVIGGEKGILIVQLSQIITVLGGPNGYVLALNSFVTDVVSPEERTGSLGQVQGFQMVGIAFGFLFGGFAADLLGLVAPFKITLGLFLIGAVYVALALPSIPSDQDTAAQQQKPVGLMRFFGPLHIFTPQKWTLKDGRTSRQYGALMLGIGVFLAILATGYIATLLQMYATNEFNFSTTANGGLIFMYSSLRGLYLTIVFPRIISWGRAWLKKRGDDEDAKTTSQNAQEEAVIEVPAAPGAPRPAEVEVVDAIDGETERLSPPERKDEQDTFAFDLLYARCSILVEGTITGFAVFLSEGWQLYLIAFLLPLAAGTGSASKGTIMQMLPSKDRVDALSGITLVENVARLATISVFGFVYAALAEQGQPKFVFLCNAGVALLSFTALAFSQFPPRGSKRVV